MDWLRDDKPLPLALALKDGTKYVPRVGRRVGKVADVSGGAALLALSKDPLDWRQQGTETDEAASGLVLLWTDLGEGKRSAKEVVAAVEEASRKRRHLQNLMGLTLAGLVFWSFMGCSEGLQRGILGCSFPDQDDLYAVLLRDMFLAFNPCLPTLLMAAGMHMRGRPVRAFDRATRDLLVATLFLCLYRYVWPVGDVRSALPVFNNTWVLVAVAMYRCAYGIVQGRTQLWDTRGARLQVAALGLLLTASAYLLPCFVVGADLPVYSVTVPIFMGLGFFIPSACLGGRRTLVHLFVAAGLMFLLVNTGLAVHVLPRTYQLSFVGGVPGSLPLRGVGIAGSFLLDFIPAVCLFATALLLLPARRLWPMTYAGGVWVAGATLHVHWQGQLRALLLWGTPVNFAAAKQLQPPLLVIAALFTFLLAVAPISSDIFHAILRCVLLPLTLPVAIFRYCFCCFLPRSN